MTKDGQSQGVGLEYSGAVMFETAVFLRDCFGRLKRDLLRLTGELPMMDGSERQKRIIRLDAGDSAGTVHRHTRKSG